MKVCEIFEGIAGEGKVAGTPTIFVRSGGCNLNCAYCFGIKEGFRVPNLYSIDKEKHTPMNEIKKGETILTYDDNKKLVETKVKKIITRDVTEYYEIVTNNKQRKYVTGEHPFFTKRGLIECKDLEIGDEIISFDWETVIKYMEQRKFEKLTFDKIKQDEWSQFDKYYKNYKNLLSKVHEGKNNINYKQESNCRNFDLLKYVLSTHRFTKCKCCNEDKILEAHHIDKDKTNDKRSNFTVLCKSCHTKIHRKGYSFWSDRTDKRTIRGVVETFLTVTAKKLVQNKTLKVYNFTCAPYNSYLIDRMWVHNCDTKYHIDSTEMHTATIAAKIKKYAIKDVTFTGGEPLLFMSELRTIRKRLGKSYKFNVETNGTIYPMLVAHVACSPKKGHINEEVLRSIRYKEDVILKFVYEDKNDLWWEPIIHRLKIDNSKIWIMPEGATRDEQLKKMPEVIAYCLRKNYNFSPRIHVLAFDDKRGV